MKKAIFTLLFFAAFVAADSMFNPTRACNTMVIEGCDGAKNCNPSSINIRKPCPLDSAENLAIRHAQELGVIIDHMVELDVWYSFKIAH